MRRKRSGQPTEDMAEPKVETPQSLAQKMAEENAKSANDDNDDDDEFAGDKKDKSESESGAEQESQSLTDSIAVKKPIQNLKAAPQKKMKTMTLPFSDRHLKHLRVKSKKHPCFVNCSD